MTIATSPIAMYVPPAPGKLDANCLIELGKELLGPNNYEDIYVFTVTFLHLREIDRHLRDLNEMRRDVEWLDRQLSLVRSAESPQRAVWSAMAAWLHEETLRHNSAVAQLHVAVTNAKGAHSKAAAAAEQTARPTFGMWLEVAPSRT